MSNNPDAVLQVHIAINKMWSQYSAIPCQANPDHHLCCTLLVPDAMIRGGRPFPYLKYFTAFFVFTSEYSDNITSSDVIRLDGQAENTELSEMSEMSEKISEMSEMSEKISEISEMSEKISEMSEMSEKISEKISEMSEM